MVGLIDFPGAAGAGIDGPALALPNFMGGRPSHGPVQFAGDCQQRIAPGFRFQLARVPAPEQPVVAVPAEF